MSKSDEKLAQLQVRLDNLAKYESAFKREIADIRREIAILKSGTHETRPRSEPFQERQIPRKTVQAKPPKRPASTPRSEPQPPNLYKEIPESTAFDKSNLEQFVGTYLISIIGVVVTVIGVGIGAKYAIDNNLISPLFRIVFGYTVGLALTGFAVHLRAKYENFSAVLLSGGMAIMYFITYFAFSYYSLISQTTAFSLMVIFTIFTVLASINFNRQIIAHIGLVGAYAVPFLLSDDSGRAYILFSYIALINIGILAVSVRKYWIPLFYTSFAFTWLIFNAWYVERFVHNEHFSLALSFATIFFLTFYTTFLAYKVVRKDPLAFVNISLILVNSFVYFGLGYAMLDQGSTASFLGLFAIANAFIHFVVAAIIHRYDLGDKNAFYLTVALVLTFTAITFPVQFDGNWVTVLWMAEATFLFVIGRTKRIPVFEYLSYPLMFVASVSLADDWFAVYQSRYRFDLLNDIPVWNGYFASSLFVALGFGAIYLVDRARKYKPQIEENLSILIGYLIPIAFGFVLYNTFRMEIGNYFLYQQFHSTIAAPGTEVDMFSRQDSALNLLNIIWQINYTLFFLTVLSYINIRNTKSTVLGIVSIGLSAVSVFVYLTIGLVAQGELRGLYISQIDAEYFYRGVYLLLVRYISLVFLAGAVWSIYRQTKEAFLTKQFPAVLLEALFDIGLSISLLVILSVELITWTDLMRIDESYKLGLSILWGVFSVGLIVTGIVYRKKHLRILAIFILAMTVVKLFTYDFAELDTVSKTIGFVAVGFLLLIASFLYNKYTKIIFGDEEIE